MNIIICIKAEQSGIIILFQKSMPKSNKARAICSQLRIACASLTFMLGTANMKNENKNSNKFIDVGMCYFAESVPVAATINIYLKKILIFWLVWFSFEYSFIHLFWAETDAPRTCVIIHHLCSRFFLSFTHALHHSDSTINYKMEMVCVTQHTHWNHSIQGDQFIECRSKWERIFQSSEQHGTSWKAMIVSSNHWVFESWRAWLISQVCPICTCEMAIGLTLFRSNAR